MSGPQATLLTGDLLDVLPTLAEASVHCVVTSPPYWGLRDYGITPRVWGGDPACAHEWGEPVLKRGGGGQPGEKVRWQHTGAGVNGHPASDGGSFCSLCGGWRGALGLEPDYRMYVENMVDCFRAIRRVLRPDGTAWLVIGDCFATGAGRVGEAPGGGEQGARWMGEVSRHRDARRRPHSQPDRNGRGEDQSSPKGYRGTHTAEHAGKAASRVAAMGPVTQPNRMPQPGLKPKDLAMIPSRVALALQEDGWWIRQRIVWDKPNPMPESVRDRPTLSHEEIILLAKSERYFYDWLAIAEPCESGPSDLRKMEEGEDRYGGKTLLNDDKRYKANNLSRIGKKRAVGVPGQRNARSVWRIATVPYTGSHFATFPPELVDRCIRAGTSDGGCCAACGAHAVRLLAVPKRADGRSSRNGRRQVAEGKSPADTKWHGDRLNSHMGSSVPWEPTVRDTVGWALPCEHEAARVPCVVLDPFGGSGTVAATAVGLGRRSTYIDVSPAYRDLARDRIGPLLCADAHA